MARVWGRVAEVYDTAIPFFSVLGRRLVEILDPQPGERVLDVATGRGACLFPAAESVGGEGFVVGFDVSAEMVTETARDLPGRNRTNVAVLVTDAERLGFVAETFDVVTCSQAVGQFPHPDMAAQEFRRVLRSGGRLGVQRDVGGDPRWDFTTDAYAAYLHLLPTPPEPRSKVDVARVLEDAGFEHVERRQDTMTLVFPDERAWWDWAWTTGSGRRHLEPLPEDARAEYRAVVFEQMQLLRTPDGFPMDFTIECVLAER